MAGAGLRQPTDIIITQFEKKTGIRTVVEYGGSGKLFTRYNTLSKGDLFMPGDYFYIDKLKALGKIASDSPVVYHTPVIAVNKKRGIIINSLEGLTQNGLRLALGDPKAMALGRTADEILTKSGYRDGILKNVVTYGATVKQLSLYVAQGSVDASIIARADAFQLTDKVEIIPIPKIYYTPSKIGIGILSSSANQDTAMKFKNFILTKKSINIFVKKGFLPIK